MASILTPGRLVRVAQAKSDCIKNWKEGASLENDSGRNIDYLLCHVAADRWKLAYSFRTQANKLFTIDQPQFRSAVSRYYYCMYHAMRACAFLYHQGDDYESHSNLPLNIPTDFDPPTDWQNKLKNARLLRNRADYEAYPRSDAAWRKHAVTIKADADRLLATARAYLLGKGCSL